MNLNFIMIMCFNDYLGVGVRLSHFLKVKRGWGRVVTPKKNRRGVDLVILLCGAGRLRHVQKKNKEDPERK